jgi:predicted aldo/keto reductase-like oxidoreductase
MAVKPTMAETEEELRRYFEEQVENTIPGYWDSWLMKQLNGSDHFLTQTIAHNRCPNLSLENTKDLEALQNNSIVPFE